MLLSSSLVSLFSFLSYIRSIILCFLLFNFSFLGFPFLLCLLLHLYGSYAFCYLRSSLFFLPPSLFLPLFATKDDASDKTDGKIISLCFTSDNLLMLFFFFLSSSSSFPFSSLHSSPPVHILLLLLSQRVATAPPAVRLSFNPHCITTHHINYTSKIIFCFNLI